MPVPSAALGPEPVGDPPAGHASSNPFAEAGDYAAAGSATASAPGDASNPYAAPLAWADEREGVAGQGLPWEKEPLSLSAWWQTAKWCLTEPSRAFAALRPGGDMGRAMLFCGLGLLVGGVVQLVWVLPLTLVGWAVQGNRPETLLVQVVLQLVQALVGSVIGATVGLLLGAAIVHGALLVVGGASRPFETTFRVLGYVNGSTAWLSIIPCVGPLIALVWSLVIEVAGLAAAHRISPGRALLAVLLPIVVCGLVCGLGLAWMIFLVRLGQGP